MTMHAKTKAVVYTAEDTLVAGIAAMERSGWSVANVTSIALGRPQVIVVYREGEG